MPKSKPPKLKTVRLWAVVKGDRIHDDHCFYLYGKPLQLLFVKKWQALENSRPGERVARVEIREVPR